MALTYQKYQSKVRPYVIVLKLCKKFKRQLIALANNKTPGPDGIPSEFYKTFWTELGNEVFNTFIKSFEKCELTKSQKQGIINLIPKKENI